MDTHCLDVELPLQSQVGIRVINSIQLSPVAPDPTGCTWVAQAFWEDGRMVTLAFVREDIALSWLGTLSTAGNMGDRMRWLGTTGC